MWATPILWWLHDTETEQVKVKVGVSLLLLKYLKSIRYMRNFSQERTTNFHVRNCILSSGEQAFYVKDSGSLTAMTRSVINLTNHSHHIWLINDFNLPGIMWKNVSNGMDDSTKKIPGLPGKCIPFPNGQKPTKWKMSWACLLLPTTRQSLLHETMLWQTKTIFFLKWTPSQIYSARKGNLPIWGKDDWNDINTHPNEELGSLPQKANNNSSGDSHWVGFKTTLEGVI